MLCNFWGVSEVFLGCFRGFGGVFIVIMRCLKGFEEVSECLKIWKDVKIIGVLWKFFEGFSKGLCGFEV